MHSVSLGQSSEIEHSNCENTAVDASVVEVTAVIVVSFCPSLSVMLKVSVLEAAVVEVSVVMEVLPACTQMQTELGGQYSMAFVV
jgi:hypothetical protein